MYIAVGTPKIVSERFHTEFGGGFSESTGQDQESSNSSILVVKKHYSKNIFCSITSNTCCLWSIKVMNL